MKEVSPEAFGNVTRDRKKEDSTSVTQRVVLKEDNTDVNQSSKGLIINNDTLSHTAEQSPPSYYPGNYIETDTKPIAQIDGAVPREDGYQKLEFPDPAIMLNFYDKTLRENIDGYSLHKWQVETFEEAVEAKPHQKDPYKLALLTCNGSGKDAIIIAGWSIWFMISKIRSRCIITSSSGVQLTSQTENYIRALAQKINEFHGCELIRIRQRYFYCALSGSEIRMFATDEAGKAEGYHPLEPSSEMCIIINEAKTVTEEIHGALRRCTGYNYWFEISSAGEPFGSFYKAYCNWEHTRRITAYDCPHIPTKEIEAAKKDFGEHSAIFRSIYLALFTSLGGEVIITQELIEKLREHFKVEQQVAVLEDRIGLDLAAGGDENAICRTRGGKCIKEEFFREEDTEITSDRIDHILKVQWKIEKTCKHIYADDGGVGRSIIDKLVRKGWIINRVLNQSRATLNKVYGNRGAENWYRVLRIFEERCFDVTTLTEVTLQQIYTRHYKKTLTNSRIFLEAKKEAKAEGRPSPDRADAFILSLTGLTVDDFLNAAKSSTDTKIDKRPRQSFQTPYEVAEYYENEVTFGNSRLKDQTKRRIFNSLKMATRN